MRRVFLAALILILALIAAGFVLIPLLSGGPAGQPHLRLTKTVTLPGQGGRFDHMDIDQKHNRLFLADVADGTLDIIDLATSNVTILSGFERPHGVLYVSSDNEIYVTSGDGSVKILDGTTLRALGSLSLSTDADNIRFDSTKNLVLVAFGQVPSGGIAFINASTTSLLRTVPLGGHPEAFEVEPTSGKVFVNFPVRSSIVTIDEASFGVVGNFTLPNALDNFPVALDHSSGRLFVATWFPSQLLVLDVPPKKVLATVTIPRDADDVFYDSQTRSVLISTGEGYVQLIRQSSPDNYASAGNVTTRPGARTSLLSPELRELFVALPATPTAQAELRVYTLAVGGEQPPAASAMVVRVRPIALADFTAHSLGHRPGSRLSPGLPFQQTFGHIPDSG